jgi:hypothetical protein
MRNSALPFLTPHVLYGVIEPIMLTHTCVTQKLNGEFYEGISHESGIEALLRHKDMGTPRPDTIIGYFLIM